MHINTLTTTSNFLHFQDVAESTDLHSSSQISHPTPVKPQLGGCVDSPEAASLVLLCVGMAGLALGTRIFHRITAALIPRPL